MATPHIITTGIEHHAVLNTAQALEKRGVSVTYVRVGPSGVVDPEDVRRAIRPETVLISIMHANNEIGTIQPLEEIGGIAREHDIYFHTDAVQSVGKIPVDVEKFGVDLLSLSAHKLNGPKGVGAMYIRKGTILKPLLYGGHHERDRRPGTENVPGIVGLGMAAELALAHLEEDAQRVAALRDRLERGILERVPQVTRERRPAAAPPHHQQPLLRLRRGRRLRHRHGPEGRRLLDRGGVFLRLGRAFARPLRHRLNAGAGEIEHPVEPGPLQYRRRYRRHARSPSCRGRTAACGFATLQAGRG